MNKVLALAMLALLGGCSSHPNNMHYYLLHDPVQHHQTRDVSDWPVVELSALAIPDYLMQRSLVVQLSNSELHFAPQHLWSAPFDQSLVQALKDTLSAQHKIRLQLKNTWTNPVTPDYILNLSVDDLLPTHHGAVLLRGTYRISAAQQQGNIVEFVFEHPLSSNGFAHSVENMRAAIADLANHIATELNER